MTFLAPLFLAGMAAIALPILMHLRKNRPAKTIPFSSLMFLEASPPVSKRRSRLQDVILLLLRCLALAALILAFARPFFRSPAKTPPAAAGQAMNLILIDTSASMRGEPLQRALSAADEWLGKVPEGEMISVAEFSDGLEMLLGPDRALEMAPGERKSAARAALASLEAGWRGTSLDAALLAAAGLSDGSMPWEIHVFGDLQKGSNLDRLQGEVWPERMQVVIHPILPKGKWTNAGISILPANGQVTRVRITNSEGSAKSDFQLSWNGKSASVSVAPGESSVFDAPEGTAVEGKVTLTGDDFTFDNEASWTAFTRPQVTVWTPGIQVVTDPAEVGYFISRALQTTDDYETRISSEAPAEPAALAISDGRMTAAELAAMRDFLKSGGRGLVAVHDAGSAATIASFLGVANSAAREARVGDHARFGGIDFKSPVFAPFADARYSDFSGIRIWKYRVLPKDLVNRGTVLASFDSGDAAWISYPVGKGTLHVLTTTWRPGDSQLALSTKFPTLLHSLLEVPQARRGSMWVGEPFQLPDPAKRGIRTPVGATVQVAEGKTFDATETPGIYEGDGYKFAVQIPSAESELTPLAESELRKLGVPVDPPGIAANAAEVQVHLSDIEQEHRQRIGWWALIAAAGFFLAETSWAARTSRTLTPRAS